MIVCVNINYLGDMDLVELMDCADFAAKKHTNQRRKNAAATPYINHPIGNLILFIEIYADQYSNF